MNLNNFKIGDKVYIFLNEDNEVSCNPTNKTILATIFAIGNVGGYFLGWKNDETRPNDAAPRNGMAASGIDYISGQSEYRWRYVVDKEELGKFQVSKSPSANISSPSPSPSPSPSSDMDLSTWRAWAHNVPGECPCGTSRSVCIYHKDA